MKLFHINDVNSQLVRELFPDDSSQRVAHKFGFLGLVKSVSRAIREAYGECDEVTIISSVITMNGVAFRFDSCDEFADQFETMKLTLNRLGIRTEIESEVAADEIK